MEGQTHLLTLGNEKKKENHKAHKIIVNLSCVTINMKSKNENEKIIIINFY